MSEQPEGVGDEAMTEQPEKKAPLIERLEAVPAYARLVIFDGPFTPTDFPVGIIHPASTTYPVGAMTHEAAAELRRLHEVNAELRKAVDLSLIALEMECTSPPIDETALAMKACRAAINKAEEPKP